MRFAVFALFASMLVMPAYGKGHAAVSHVGRSVRPSKARAHKPGKPFKVKRYKVPSAKKSRFGVKARKGN